MDPLPADKLFAPKVLRWARVARGISVEVVATKLSAHFRGLTTEHVEQWENGTTFPTPAHVRKLAALYKRPTAVFLLAHHPDENPLPPDRRTLRAAEDRDFSPEALLVMRRARRVQELAQELDQDFGTTRGFKYRKHAQSEDPVVLAASIRADLGVSLTDQLSARRYAEFFEYLRARIEAAGVLTLRTSRHNGFPTRDARALSFTDRQPYVILVNNKDTEGAKTFSLLHELAHILVREAGICNNFGAFTDHRGRVDTLEVFCNQFAADFLVPSDALLSHRLLVGKTRVEPEELEHLVGSLALAFKVSRFVVLRRLLTHRLVTRETYNRKANEWEKERPPARKGGKAVPARTAVLSNGVAFTSLVVEARRHDKISAAAAADYLSIKARYLPGVEKELNRHAHGS